MFDPIEGIRLMREIIKMQVMIAPAPGVLGKEREPLVKSGAGTGVRDSAQPLLMVLALVQQRLGMPVSLSPNLQA